jgi:ACR3 family arsenite efflux pump ArsB
MNVSILSKLQPLFIILAAFLGVITGKSAPSIAGSAGNYIEIFLMAMLFFVFLPVNIKDITN